MHFVAEHYSVSIWLHTHSDGWEVGVGRRWLASFTSIGTFVCLCVRHGAVIVRHDHG